VLVKWRKIIHQHIAKKRKVSVFLSEGFKEHFSVLRVRCGMGNEEMNDSMQDTGE